MQHDTDAIEVVIKKTTTIKDLSNIAMERFKKGCPPKIHIKRKSSEDLLCQKPDILIKDVLNRKVEVESFHAIFSKAHIIKLTIVNNLINICNLRLSYYLKYYKNDLLMTYFSIKHFRSALKINN